MADKDVATGTLRAVLPGITVALVLTMAATSTALANAPDGKGKPEAKTQAPALESVDERGKRRAATGGVLGVTETNLGPQTAALPVAEEDDGGGSLPFTGLWFGVLLLIGAMWLMAGALARVASHSELD